MPRRKMTTPSEIQDRRRKVQILGESQNWRCGYCGVRFYDGPGKGEHEHAISLDEVIPRSLGGSTDIDNQIAACRGCNTERGSADAYSFADSKIGRVRRARAEWVNAHGYLLHPPTAGPASWRARTITKLEHVRSLIPEVVEMTPARAEYFALVYGHRSG